MVLDLSIIDPVVHRGETHTGGVKEEKKRQKSIKQLSKSLILQV